MSGTLLLVLRIVAALSLYVFIGWVLYLLWRDLKTQSDLLKSRKVTPITLLIQSPDKPPRSMHFNQGEIIIGREPDCHCSLPDETASAHHTRLSHHHNQWWVEDLQSTNGTKLNGERITVPTVIISGDKINCGHTQITISLAGSGINEPTLPL